MSELMRYPQFVFILSLAVLLLAARIGAAFEGLQEKDLEIFNVVRSAALTLLGLIIGFSFSMASSRYDQRKDLEQAEASAISTEYTRADVLPAADAAKVRAMLISYLDERLLYYRTREDRQLEQINSTLSRLEGELWVAVRHPAEANPTQIVALAVSGVNDVSNSRGFTEAAWLNRIPSAAWLLMFGIAICCNLLLGYGLKITGARRVILLVIPLIVAICFALIADIDSPRGGVVRVRPYNLENTSRSLRSR
jgi:hypothetical protein